MHVAAKSLFFGSSTSKAVCFRAVPKLVHRYIEIETESRRRHRNVPWLILVIPKAMIIRRDVRLLQTILMTERRNNDGYDWFDMLMAQDSERSEHMSRVTFV